MPIVLEIVPAGRPTTNMKFLYNVPSVIPTKIGIVLVPVNQLGRTKVVPPDVMVTICHGPRSAEYCAVNKITSPTDKGEMPSTIVEVVKEVDCHVVVVEFKRLIVVGAT
jgi:hypothetical protein